MIASVVLHSSQYQIIEPRIRTQTTKLKSQHICHMAKCHLFWKFTHSYGKFT